MKRQEFNLHTHTYRCLHAVKDEYDYADAAIEAGFRVLGISEHIAHREAEPTRDRMSCEYMKTYFDDIEKLKRDYKDKITIYTGLEFEFLEDKLSYLKECKEKCDYMILGQHNKTLFYDYTYNCTDKDARIYADQVCRGLEENLSKYVAHPDYFMLPRDTFSKDCEKAIRQIARCAKKCDAVLEINLKGMGYKKRIYDGRESYVYPNINTIEILREEGSTIVFGYDAHSPQALLDRSREDIARKMCEGLDICTDVNRFLFKK